MTPKEFKAANKGYQLHLADQRQQTLYGHAIPQLTVPANAVDNDKMSEAFQRLSDRDKAEMDKLIGEDQPKEKQLTTGNRYFIEAMKRMEKG